MILNFSGISIFLTEAVSSGRPSPRDMLDAFWIRGNLFEDIVDQPDRFLICYPDHLDYYNQYLTEQKGWKVGEEEDFSNDFFHIYRIHLSPKERRS